MTKNNELDDFFEGLPSEDKKETVDDIFAEEPEKKESAPEEGDSKSEEGKPEKDDEPRKNRRHRRLEAQLQAEREARIRAEARAEAAAQYGVNSKGTTSGDVDPRWLRIYGDTPESREAWRLQTEIFNDYKTQTKEEAMREVQQQQAEAIRQQKEHEALIDSELEELEDQFDVDLTSDAPAARKARREFLEMVEKASPKDDDGNVINYADFGTVWEFYESKRAKAKDNSGLVNRQKEISSRSMNKSNGSKASEATITPGFDGWRKDFNLD